MDKVQVQTKFKGNFILFYAFDIGDEIDIEKIKNENLVSVKSSHLSPYFKNYHIPLSFDIENSSCISSKIHHFGVVSFCYKIPFEDSFDALKIKMIDVKKKFDEVVEADAKKSFDKMLPTIKKSYFYNLKNFYFAVQVDPIRDITPADYKTTYGSKIASLLRLENEVLSSYQEKEILEATTGYSGKDLMIIDSEASFIYDYEYDEILDFFEFTTIQQLELQYFDRLLDEKLNFFYTKGPFKIPFLAYVPFLGKKLKLPISVLSQLRVDISVITERLENSIKMVGDSYFINVYSILREQLALDDWRDSINRKLSIVNDIYSVYQDRLDIIHEEILTVVIIILIALEAVLAFVR